MKGIKQRTLGKTGIRTSSLGMGCWAIGGVLLDLQGKQSGYGTVNDEESIKAIHRAIDLGINFFDTADVYGAGHGERILGKAIKGHRDDLVVSTKFGNVFNEEKKVITGENYSSKYIRTACEASLKRLNTDYIDLYHLHSWSVLKSSLKPIIATLDDLKEEGMIKAYGWSTDLHDLAKYFVENSKAASIQHELNVLHDTKELIDICEEYDVSSINRTVLAMGLLTGKYTAGSSIPENDVRGPHSPEWLKYFKQGRPDFEWLKKLEMIKDILASDGRTIVQGALAWVWARSDKTVPIPGFKTVKQVEENVGAMEFGPMSMDQMKQINEVLGDRNFIYTSED
ncbi:MAG: aldo/keto reductase [Candidatus Lokiarchaeota archaeon]|nr:aldo/keto reductase [Candidatus Lokiarchaeota archaeon]